MHKHLLNLGQFIASAHQRETMGFGAVELGEDQVFPALMGRWAQSVV